MLTDFQERKLRLLFRFNDLDGDGRITEADIEQVLANYAQAYGYPTDHPDYLELRERYGQNWSQLKAWDSDGDGSVSLEEFLAGYDNWLADKDSFMGWMDAMISAFYGIVDRDKDGFVSEEEYTMNFRAHGQSEEAARESYRRLDRDGDGLVSRDEMVTSTAEVFYSEDPDAPGNWIALAVEGG